MLLHYLKIAWRNIIKYNVQSVTSILGLAIGFMAFILAGYWYYWEHSFDTFHPDWKNTYAITTRGLNETRGANYADLNQLHEEAKNAFILYPEIESYCTTEDVSFIAKDNDRRWMGMRVDTAFFNIFSCDLVAGTYKGNAYDNKSVILTQSMAKQIFGDEECVGKSFIVSKNSFTIVGVMKDYPDNSNFKFNYLLLGQPEYGTFVKRLPTYIRVKPNVDKQKLQEKISSYKMRQQDTKFHKYSEWKFNLCALPDIHITCSPELDTRFRNIKIVLIGGLLAFLSALMNLLVLFISRQRLKVRDNSLYRTIGASTKGLVLRGIAELTVLLFISFLISMTFVELIFPSYQRYAQLENYGIFKDFIHFLSKEQLTVIAIGSYWIISSIFLLLSTLPIYGLMKKARSDVSALFRDVLIIGQIFIGTLFLVAAFAFYSQFRYTHNKDKGIKTENIWQIDLGFETSWEKDYMPFIEQLKQSSYIDDVTTLTNPIFSSLRQFYCSYITRLPIQGKDDNYSDDHVVAVEPNFFSFFGLQIQQGEWPSDKGIPEYTINETGAKLINLENDFSKVYEIAETDGQQFRISGIMKDYHYFPMQYPLEKTFFHIPSQEEKENLLLKTPYIYIKIKPEHEKQALEFTRKQYNDFSKDEVAPDKQIQYLSDILLELNAADINMSRIFLSLAIICVLMSSLGIYSLVALATKQRKKEIAIRKINGAKFRDVLNLFLKRYLVLTIISNTVALPLGFLFVSRWLETYAYHFKLTIGMFVLVLVITISIVTLSVVQQVRRTIKMNEAEVVKSE